MTTLFTRREPNFVGQVPHFVWDDRGEALTRNSTLDVRRWALDVLWLPGRYRLYLIPQPLLVPMRPHALAALMLRNFCFPSFF